MLDIEWIREYCLSFPGTTEQILWGDDLVFKVAGKMFCVTVLNPEHRVKMSFKCTPEKFHELIELPDIIPAPYSARNHWVALESWSALRISEVKSLLAESYALVIQKLPKKTQAEVAIMKPRKTLKKASKRAKKK